MASDLSTSFIGNGRFALRCNPDGTYSAFQMLAPLEALDRADAVAVALRGRRRPALWLGRERYSTRSAAMAVLRQHEATL